MSILGTKSSAIYRFIVYGVLGFLRFYLVFRGKRRSDNGPDFTHDDPDP